MILIKYQFYAKFLITASLPEVEEEVESFPMPISSGSSLVGESLVVRSGLCLAGTLEGDARAGQI